MNSVPFQGKPFNITVIQAYVPTSNAEEAEVELFYEDLQDPLELTPKKDILFIIVQLSHPYTTTGKTTVLTIRTFVDKVMRLLFSMLSRLVITFLPRSKRLLISWLQSPSAVILDHFQFALIHAPNIPGSYAILLFIALNFTSITSYIHNWVLFLLWLCLFHLSGAISPLICSSILGTYRPGEFISRVLSFCLFIVFMGFSRKEY